MKKKIFSFELNMKVIHVLILTFIFDIFMIVGYNLNTNDPFIIKYNNSSYFGYSIVLHKSAMIVGAPKDNYSVGRQFHTLPHEPGAVWKYIFNTGEFKQLTPKIPDEIGFIKSNNLTTLIMKKNGWFGASIALQDNNDVLTICAPRTIVALIAEVQGLQFGYYSMHGICYTGKISTGKFQIEDPNLSSYDFSVLYRFHPLRGFSVHYPFSHSNLTKNNGKMIMGCPKHELVGSVRIENQSTPVWLSKIDELAQFGYVVSSGRFFDRDKLLYVGGGPGSNLVGQVGIVDPSTNPATIISILNGITIGEYFGASLAVGDMNNDGLDDLIVGAPHWGNDNGRVYIYLGNANGFSKADAVLDGDFDGGMFGYAVTSGDLDADGFDDLIVGAPYRNGGAIYIYNGDLNINQEIEKTFQKVDMYPQIKTFGFSLAKPVDIDANGFPDVGVGAYKSGHAIIMKSRPVVQTNLRVSSVPHSLYQNASNFIVEICVKHTERNLPVIKSFDLILNVDEHFKRVNKSQILLEYISIQNISTVTTVCLNTTVHILENVDKNYFDPIDIVVIHKFRQMQGLRNNNIVESELCPIEAKGALSKTSKLSVPFDLGCGLDKVCLAVITLRANFYGNKTAWIIGSEDITYEVYITNYGEPAYSTKITVEIPQGISLRTYLPSCDKHGDVTGILKMTCDVKNPLFVNNTKKIEFVLDMSQLNDGSVNGTYLNFNVSVKTRSENGGTHNISTSLLLLSHIVTVVEGNSDDRNYNYTLDDETMSIINFQHSYEVLKSGATPIGKANLNIEVPTKFGDLGLIVLMNEPNIHISGKMYKCTVIGIPIRGISKNYVLKTLSVEQLRKARDINELPQRVSTVHESEFNITTDNNVMSLDCLSSKVSCGKIICDIPSLKSKKNSVTLQLQFSVNLKLLMDEQKSYEKNFVIFTTQGWIEIIKPLFESKRITKVSTVFHQVKKLKSLMLWIIIGSVLLGLLVLFIIAILLWQLGFFRRTKKDTMEALKTENVVNNFIQAQDNKF